MKKIYLFLLLFLLCNLTWADPLPSWNDGVIKKNIINFVTSVTNKNDPNYILSQNRIATFDNDGTLWVEQPIYTQFIFAISRIKTLAATHPEWNTTPPYSILLSGNRQAISQLNMKDIEQILAVTHAGMTVEDFDKIVREWLATNKDPHFKRLYTKNVYQPMIEIMNYLRENGFQIYIVTGGGQEFVRAFSEKTYNIPVNMVIGTIGKTKYTYIADKPAIVKEPQVLFIDNKQGKPEAIAMFIGKKPVIAFGNSDGDQQMLEWTQSNSLPHMMLLVHHDDAAREYAYGPDSKVGTFSNALMEEAKKNNWSVISMKNDWKKVFK